MFKGFAMLIGGIALMALSVTEWFRWRTGKPPLLNFSRNNAAHEGRPKSGMNGIIETMEVIGWTLLGLLVALYGLAILTS